MPHSEDAATYVRIGQSLEHLRLAKTGPRDRFVALTGDLLKELQAAELPVAASTLRILSDSSFPSDNGSIPTSLHGQIETAIATVSAAVLTESTARLLRRLEK